MSIRVAIYVQDFVVLHIAPYYANNIYSLTWISEITW